MGADAIGSDLKWIIGLSLTVMIALLSVMWGILESRRKTFETRVDQWMRDKEKAESDFRTIEYAPVIAGINKQLWPMDERVKTLEREQVKVEEWKHATVDPIVPRAVEDHERRLNRMEDVVFAVTPRFARGGDREPPGKS